MCAKCKIALLALLLASCQTVTVQIGDTPSADRASGVKAETSINKKEKQP
jgi:hypothetical protein